MNCPYFDSAEDLLAALRGMFDHYRIAAISDAPQRPAGLPETLPPIGDLPKLVARMALPFRRPFHAQHSIRLSRAASMIGFPVVLKGNVTGVTHKTELQAVKLGLKRCGRCRSGLAGYRRVCCRARSDRRIRRLHCAGAGGARRRTAAVDPARSTVRTVGDGGRRRHVGRIAARCRLGARAGIARRRAADGTEFAHCQAAGRAGAATRRAT